MPLACVNCTHLAVGPESNATEATQAQFVDAAAPTLPQPNRRFNVVAARVPLSASSSSLGAPLAALLMLTPADDWGRNSMWLWRIISKFTDFLRLEHAEHPSLFWLCNIQTHGGTMI